MSARTVIVIVLALVFGLVAALLVHQMANRPSLPGPSDTVDVLVATVDIPPGTEIREGMFKPEPYPKDRLPPNHVSKKEDVLERAALMHILKEDPIVTTRLTEKGQLGLAPLIKPGWRAYTVRVVDPAAGVGNFLLPRSKVDVLLTLKGRGDDSEGGPVTTVLLQNVEVLAVGSQLSTSKTNDKKKDTERTRNVTFLVEPKHANKLQLGTNLGSLHLVLRNPEDKTEEEIEEATLASIRQGGDFAGEAWEERAKKDQRMVDEKLKEFKEEFLKVIAEKTRQSGGGLATGPNGEPNQIFIRTFQGDTPSYVGVIKQSAGAAPPPKQD